jgi:hypothetical protein
VVAGLAATDLIGSHVWTRSGQRYPGAAESAACRQRVLEYLLPRVSLAIDVGHAAVDFEVGPIGDLNHSSI